MTEHAKYSKYFYQRFESLQLRFFANFFKIQHRKSYLNQDKRILNDYTEKRGISL